MVLSFEPAGPLSTLTAQLSGIGDFLASGADLSEALREAVGHARDMTNADYAAVCVLDEDGAPERMVYAGRDGDFRRRVRLPTMGGVLDSMARAEEATRLDDVTQHPRFIAWHGHHPRVGPIIGQPIRAGGRSLGCLYISRNRDGAPFGAEDEAAASVLGLQVGILLAAILDRGRSGRAFVLEERQRIAHDLRNSSVQSLVDLAGWLASVSTGPEAGMQPAMRNGAVALEALAEELRQYVEMLEAEEPPGEPDLARDLPFVVRQLVPPGIATVVNVTVLPGDIGGRSAEDLLHLTREALSNAARHARPTKIAVDLRRIGSEVALTIQDDGIGFDPDAQRVGLGITSMRTRAERLGASLAIIGVPGMGTAVRVVTPGGAALPD